LAWDFDDGIAALEGLSLAVGVAVRRALAGLGAGDIGLKWPNDLLRDGRKLGGILVEVAGDPEGRCRAVIGIGINVAMPRRRTSSYTINIARPTSETRCTLT
jgi:BirA family biotin operon repressor/biotin-[acetyl-CoA-carboxylase] ligase